MTDLSPAARAVLEVYRQPYIYRNLYAAAAMRVLADQVVPEEPEPKGMRPAGDVYSAREIKRGQRQNTRAEILAIAAELEGNND